MGKEDRDWYRDYWRRRDGYTERATFRVSEKERQRMARRKAWQRSLTNVALWVIVIFALLHILKNHVLPLF